MWKWVINTDCDVTITGLEFYFVHIVNSQDMITHKLCLSILHVDQGINWPITWAKAVWCRGSSQPLLQHSWAFAAASTAAGQEYCTPAELIHFSPAGFKREVSTPCNHHCSHCVAWRVFTKWSSSKHWYWLAAQSGPADLRV